MIETFRGYGDIPDTYSSEAAMALERLERVVATTQAASRGVRSVASLAGLRGCGTEVAWLAAHAAALPARLRHRPAAGRPRPAPDSTASRRCSAACSSPT